MSLFILLLELAVLLAEKFPQFSVFRWYLVNLQTQIKKGIQLQFSRQGTFALSLFLVLGLSLCLAAEGGDADGLNDFAL